MLTGWFQTVVIVLVVLLFYGMDFFFIHRYDRQRLSARSGRAWDFTLAMLGAALVLILQPLYLPWLGLSIPWRWGLGIQIAGMVLILISLALHGWARLHLGRFYAERVEVLPNHEVVDSGPYAYVRHPIITSFFGIAVGLFLVNPAVPTFLMMVYVFWDFGRAALQEEKLLLEKLPDYADYLQRTPRFLPRWRRR